MKPLSPVLPRLGVKSSFQKSHKNATDEDGNSEDEDESYDDDSDEDLFTNEYLDGGKEQSCGGFCDKVDSDAVVEDCLIKDKSKSTNKVANQKVNYEGLVAVSAFSNGSQSSSRDTCGTNVKNGVLRSLMSIILLLLLGLPI
ncbi:hypothetical protein Tco_0186362 [Tanacetum coccineum]